MLFKLVIHPWVEHNFPPDLKAPFLATPPVQTGMSQSLNFMVTALCYAANQTEISLDNVSHT